jgi:nucleotide-binding universal stress UspA family protein
LEIRLPPSKKIADDLKADLIVMGTRGLKGLKHKLVESTADYVMKNSTMPVITISPVCTNLIEDSTGS